MIQHQRWYGGIALLATAAAVFALWLLPRAGPDVPEEHGTWVWEYPDEMSEARMEHFVSAAADNGFTALYLTVDNYPPLSRPEANAPRAEEQSAYLDALASFVRKAQARGLSVDLVGGAPDWGAPENRWRGYALVELLAAYNAAHPEAPARGLQFDVESYLMPAYEENQASVLQDFIDFAHEAAARMRSQNPDARFSFVVPHFYDARIGWTPPVYYQDRPVHTYTALLQILEQNEDSALLVMAYRNFHEGENGTKDIAEAEVREASRIGYETKVIVVQETGNVPPEYVTFYGHPKQALLDALEKIRRDFGKYRSYGGTAVHYLDPFLELE